MRFVPFVSLLLVSPCFGRLGDTREQAEARYGLPKSEKPSKLAGPLLEGARELTFEFEGWRIRCALLPAKDGQEYIVREEYTHKSGIPTIKDFERDAILQAESGSLAWESKSAALSLNPLKILQDQFKGMLGGPTWVRSDGAVAVHSQNMFPVRLQLPQAQAWESEVARLADQRARKEASRILQADESATRPVATRPAAPLSVTPLPMSPSTLNAGPRKPQAATPITVRRSTPVAVQQPVMFPSLSQIVPARAEPAKPSPPVGTPLWFTLAVSVGLLLAVPTILVALIIAVIRRLAGSSTRTSGHSGGVSAPVVQAPPPLSIGQPRTVKDVTWDEFELLVGEIYRRQGYQAELSAGTGSDGGVDLVLRRGDERILVQCKSWKAWKVNVGEIREFFGVLTAEQASRGIFVTTGSFTRDAMDFAAGKPIEMIDGPALDKLIRTASSDANDDLLNVELWAPVFLKASKVTVPPCPYCKSTMVKRSGSKGNFWGCPTFPRCRGKRELRKHVEA